MLPVPPQSQGFWRRCELNDSEITSAEVSLYIQTKHHFAEIRTNQVQAVEEAQCLGLASEKALLALAQQDASAGMVHVEDEDYVWGRIIQFRPCPEIKPERTRIALTESGMLRESTIEGAIIQEFEPLPGTEGSSWGFTLSGEKSAFYQERKGYLFGIGNIFCFAANRRHEAGENACTEGLTEDQRRCALGCEISMGRIEGSSTNWEVDYSTLPGRRGRSLLDPHVTFKGIWQNVWEAKGKLLAGRYAPAFGWQITSAYSNIEKSVLESMPSFKQSIMSEKSISQAQDLQPGLSLISAPQELQAVG